MMPAVTLVLQLGTITRASPHVKSTVYLSDTRYSTEAGGGGVPANLQLQALIVRESVKGGPRIRTASDPGVDEEGRAVDDIVEVEGKRKKGGVDGDDPGLDGVEIIGQPAKLIEVGELFGSTFTLDDPFVYAKGIVAPGSVINWDTFLVRILPTPLVWSQPAVTQFSGRGPALLFPAGATARAVWPAHDPPGDFSIFFWMWNALEDWETAGTVTLIDNGDWAIQIVDSFLKVTVAHATTDAVVTSALLPRPEAFFAGRVVFTAGAGANGGGSVELFVDSVSQGSDAGDGAPDANNRSWAIGSNQTEDGEFYPGFTADIWFFDLAVDEETATGYETSRLTRNEPGLKAALEGQLISDSVLLDNAAATDEGGGLVGFPSTAHGFLVGQEVTMRLTDNYDDVILALVDSSTTANLIVALAPGGFIAETFDGDETATIDFAFLFDEAQVNSAAPLSAVVKGARPGTSFGGGVAAGATSIDTLGGTVHERASGPVEHMLGRQIDSEDNIFLHGDPVRGQGFKTLEQGGVDVKITEKLSLLALYAATITSTEAVADPILGISRLETRTEGSVTCSVPGESPFKRGLILDGIDDFISFGTSGNALFTDSFTVRLYVSYLPVRGSNVEILTNRAVGSAGIVIADEIDPDDASFRRIGVRLDNGLSILADLSYRYSVGLSTQVTKTSSGLGERLSVELVWTVERTGAGPVFDWDSFLYIDGLPVDSDSLSGTAVASASSLFLGRNVAGDEFWAGIVSELSFF